MFAARVSTLARSLSRRVPTSSSAASAGRATTGARRNMGGGAHWLEVSPHHTMAGEVMGFFTWLWIFYRAKNDLPVVLGLRHPWEHGDDPWAVHDHVENLEGLEKEWEEFAEKSGRPGEDDDDDDDDDDEDDDDDDDDDDE
mmetsp:Transcript_23871/g.40839  ORF Transcript_23871/g.40839 Transcript_23871/m.40839 type:complete len:141 (-) Transcript_23871:145-567(-)|eukprot:CAMPEP_0183721248 /NCGR_PEP_ID=MMETSP0737-20130205/13585_1 /TAXON_ID=385413 /ORGANISM="Thalassiosira miniscula, Strain CCMP1093" /LENGTH=140 /DNA_ID=CAMNT_0025951223 /DNA_START=142 /DNA_END=564 /DNA_ORIENTATION=+